MKLICTLAAAGAVALLATSPAAPVTKPKLIGTVGPGFTITLKQNGRAVKKLKPGNYTFVIADKASIHNFVLEGPGVERDMTTVPFTGTKTVLVKLRKGKYKFYCRPHESSMFGFVTVA